MSSKFCDESQSKFDVSKFVMRNNVSCNCASLVVSDANAKEMLVKIAITFY